MEDVAPASEVEGPQQPPSTDNSPGSPPLSPSRASSPRRSRSGARRPLARPPIKSVSYEVVNTEPPSAASLADPEDPEAGEAAEAGATSDEPPLPLALEEASKPQSHHIQPLLTMAFPPFQIVLADAARRENEAMKEDLVGLLDMGFDRATANEALILGGSLESAVEMLLTGSVVGPPALDFSCSGPLGACSLTSHACHLGPRPSAESERERDKSAAP